MYGKLTEKIRKGFKLLKSSSKSLRKSSQSLPSTSRKLHLNRKSENKSNQNADSDKLCHAKSACFELKSDLNTTEGRVQAIFNNEYYKNWLRVVMALRVTCETMAPLVDKVMVEFQLDLREKFGGDSPNELIRAALQHHRQRISKAEVWKRSDVTKWLCPDRGVWELAKIYMPRGAAGRDLMSAKSLDVTGMLNLFTCFTPFKDYVSNLQQVHKVIQIRNGTMHNSRLEFTDDEVEQCFVVINNLLEDEILSYYLAQFPDYAERMADLDTAKTIQFTTHAVLKSSFEILEERMMSEQFTDVPSVSAMVSNREILKSLRKILDSDEFRFEVDTTQVNEKLECLESLLTMQNSVAEEKISMLFWKANYIQRQLDRLRSPASAEITTEQESVSNDPPATSSRNRKRNKRNKKRKKSNGPSYSTKHVPLLSTPSKTSKISQKSNISLSLVKLNTNKQTSFPNILSSKAFHVNSPSLSISHSTFFRKNPMGCGLQSNAEVHGGNVHSDEVVNTATSDDKANMACDEEGMADPGDLPNSSNHDDVPGPSGLQLACDSRRQAHAEKRKSSTKLGSEISAKKLLTNEEMSSSKNNGNHHDSGSVEKTLGPSDAGSGGNSMDSNGNSDGGYFQTLLRNVLKEQMQSTPPQYEDKKIGSHFSSSVRFCCRYVVKSVEPKATQEEAEIEAAVEALKRFELQVLDNKNAKPVLDQFCKAAVGNIPNYFCYPISSNMYLSVVQIHSSFASWLIIDDESIKGCDLLPGASSSRDDILLQVQTISSEERERSSLEKECVRTALVEANIDISEIMDLRNALNELCLRQGGSLPIFETGYYGNNEKSSGMMVTTMISVVTDKLHQREESDAVSLDSSNSWESHDGNDVIIAHSPQPSYTRDQSEELAAKILLEQLGVNVGRSAVETFGKPYEHFLRENASQWGYYPPQFHTFEIKPTIDVGGAFLAVASSRALRESSDSITANSDEGMDSLEDARESAAKKALLMIGYPHTFYLTP